MFKETQIYKCPFHDLPATPPAHTYYKVRPRFTSETVVNSQHVGNKKERNGKMRPKKCLEKQP